jgi:hypothetical protein
MHQRRGRFYRVRTHKPCGTRVSQQELAAALFAVIAAADAAGNAPVPLGALTGILISSDTISSLPLMLISAHAFSQCPVSGKSFLVSTKSTAQRLRPKNAIQRP